MPYDIKRVSNYSLPDAFGSCDGDETRDEPVCSTEEEGTIEEEGRSGGSDVALGQHSTVGRYQHYINEEQNMRVREKRSRAAYSCCKGDNHFESHINIQS